MAFKTIEYDEFKQSSYKAIKLSYHINGNKYTKSVNTGNYVIDFYDCMKFLANRPKDWYAENPYVVCSSSCDHFYSDGNRYHESYFDPETGEFLDWQKAFNEKNYKLFHDITDGGKYPRCAHLKQHKNFNMVKAYVQRIKSIYESLGLRHLK